MRVLVCGGREYGLVPKGCPPEQWRAYQKRAIRERFMLEETLDVLHQDNRISAIVHGAARGADSFAGEWAKRRGVGVERWPADWTAYGKAAGPIRNGRMLEGGRPDLVVAFPGGTGTADMVDKARQAGVKVMEIEL